MPPLVRLLLSAALFAASSCTYMSSKVDYEPGTDFASYHSFAIERARPVAGDAPHVAELAEAGWVDERTQARIRRILERKGMEEVPSDGADLIFRYYYVAREEIHGSSRPGHVRWLRVDIREVRYDSYTRGTLVVDVVDRSRNLLVWHGAIEGVAKTPEEPGAHLDRNLERAVDLLLRNQFPPRWPREPREKTEAETGEKPPDDSANSSDGESAPDGAE